MAELTLEQWERDRHRFKLGLARERSRQGYSLRGLAERCRSLHWTTIGKIERGDRTPKPETAQDLADALHVPLDELIA